MSDTRYCTACNRPLCDLCEPGDLCLWCDVEVVEE